jgi:multidrug efflux system membrane fusion protein
MPETIAPNRSSRNRWLLGGIVVLLAAGLAWWQWPVGNKQPGGAQGPATGGSLSGPARGGFRAMAGGGGGGPVPVRLAEAVRGDFPVELKALGTVTSYNTVSVRARVNGQLVKVPFVEGQLVKAGELLAQIDPRPFQVALQQAEGSLLQSRAELQNAELDLKRYQDLYAEDSVAKQTLDTQRAKVDQLRGTLKNLEAAVASARLNLDFTEVRAPLAGRLGLRQVDVGNLVTSGDTTPLVTITQTSPIAVSFTLPEAELSAVLQPFRAGAKLSVEAWDRGERRRLAEGVLASLDNQIDTATGTVRLKARFENADEALFPNQFVNVRLRVETRRDATLIPSAAVQFGAKGTFVYVVDADSKVQVRPVSVAASNGTQSLVGEGVAVGERLVVEGTDRLREGNKVQAIDEQAPQGKPAGGEGGKPSRHERPGKAEGAGKPAA